MPLTRLHPHFTFTEDRLAQLREVVPEAFADGKVNWEALREALGEHLEDESEPAEHFGLTWPAPLWHAPNWRRPQHTLCSTWWNARPARLA